MQIKTTMRYYLIKSDNYTKILQNIYKILSIMIICIGENVDKLETLPISGLITLIIAILENSLVLPQNRLTIKSRNFISRHISRRNENIYLHRNICIAMFISVLLIIVKSRNNLSISWWVDKSNDVCQYNRSVLLTQ